MQATPWSHTDAASSGLDNLSREAGDSAAPTTATAAMENGYSADCRAMDVTPPPEPRPAPRTEA
jgi:hypothetical protein